MIVIANRALFGPPTSLAPVLGIWNYLARTAHILALVAHSVARIVKEEVPHLGAVHALCIPSKLPLSSALGAK